MKPKRKPTVVSLFAGCGGSDEGLINAGFEVLMANDISPYARDTYLANQPETDFQLRDVCNIKSFPKVDLLVGCYPCQGFSQGGAREPDRKINYLYREFVRALKQIKPKAFIVENVSGMRRADFRHLLRSQLVQFRLQSYKVRWQLMNTADYGVAQQRKRIIFVGIRSDLNVTFDFPEPTHGIGSDMPFQTIRDAIGDLPEWPEGEYCDHDFHWYYLSRDRYRGWGELSNTIVSNWRHVPLHPVSPPLIKQGCDVWVWKYDAPARRYSYKECARLQGFKPDMVFPDTEAGRMVDRYTVVGNAVPPPLFEAVARALPDIW